jgi:hypothetical protein
MSKKLRFKKDEKMFAVISEFEILTKKNQNGGNFNIAENLLFRR